MSTENPFTLIFGMPPKTYIQREEIVSEITDYFENDISRTYFISGLRGNGKTVLLTTVANKLAETKKWLTVNLNPAMDYLEGLSNELKGIMGDDEHISELSLNVAGIGLGVKGKNSEDGDNINDIRQALKKIKKCGKKLLVTIDEVINNINIRKFASQLQIYIREELPIYVIMAGLHENIFNVQNSSELTFLLRSPKTFLKPLSISQIVSTYRNIFSVDTDTAKEMAQETKGYALAFQILGMLYWQYGLDKKDTVIDKYIAMLDDFAYTKIWEKMSGVEKNIALALSDGKKKIADIEKDAGVNASSIQKYRKRMLDKGIVVSPEYGYLELALPRFGEVINLYV